jgi:hypothetical protein
MEFEADDDLELDTLAPGASEADEIEAEMEALIEQADDDEEAAPAPTSDPDDLTDLDALLGEAMAERSTAQSVADARKKAKGGYALSPDDLARIRAWELAREWLPVANVALFHRYECKCGKHSTVYEGLMLEQRHRHNKTANRWTTQENADSKLPNQTAIRKSQVPMCPACANTKGWDMRAKLEWHI